MGFFSGMLYFLFTTSILNLPKFLKSNLKDDLGFLTQRRKEILFNGNTFIYFCFPYLSSKQMQSVKCSNLNN